MARAEKFAVEAGLVEQLDDFRKGALVAQNPNSNSIFCLCL
jgi:hypothetical protein